MKGIVQGMLDSIYGSDVINGLVDSLRFDVIGGLQGNLNGIYTNVFLPVAMYIMVIYFLVNLIDRSIMFEHMDTSQIVKQLFTLGGCYMLLLHGFEILGWLLTAGGAILDTLSGLYGVSGSSVTAMTASDFMDSVGISPGFLDLGYLGGMVFLFIPWLFSLFVPIVFKFVCYSRLIEIGVRMAMMPVSLIDFFNNGVNGSGWRNLKAFLAIAMQTVTLFIVVLVFSFIMDGVLNSGLGGFDMLMAMVAVELSCMGLAIKSQGLTKELLGA